MSKALCFAARMGTVSYLATGASQYIDPKSLSQEEFAALMLNVRAGTVRSLSFRARVFGDKTNLNFSRPEPGRLADLASNIAGALYKRDHATRAGDVRAARVVDSDGCQALEVDVDVIDAVAQENFLRGLDDRFSPEIDYQAAYCSVCKASAIPGHLGPRPTCGHSPGTMYGGIVAEQFLTGALGLHAVSSTDNPAYDDTQILAAYSRANTTGSQMWAAAEEIPTMDEKDPKALLEAALAGDADAATQLMAWLVEQFPAEDPPAEEAPPAENAEYSALQALYATQQAELDASKERAFNMLFESHVKAGRLLPSARASIRTHYGVIGHEATEAYLSGLPSAAILAPQISSAGSDTQKVEGGDALALARHMGLSKGATPERLQTVGYSKLHQPR